MRTPILLSSFNNLFAQRCVASAPLFTAVYPRPGFVTGEAIVVDGGFLAAGPN
jgi:hypothetical protein